MRLVLLPFLGLVAPAAAQTLDVPSGLPLEFHEVLLEPDTRFARFRFVAEPLGQAGWEMSDIAADFEWLCNGVVLPALEQNGWEADQIVISIADRVVEFGEVAPDAVQYFEGYSVEDGTCEWVPF